MKRSLLLKTCLAFATAVGAFSSLSFADQLPSARDLGYSIDNSNHTRPPNFSSDMQQAYKLTQLEHGCSWAVRPLIYAFRDAVVYANYEGNDYNIFDLKVVKDHGCRMPWELTPNATPKTLSSLGYSVDNLNHAQTPQFDQDMAYGQKMSPAEQACSWVVRPRIYVFPDGVVYANNDTKDYNIFDYQTVRSKGCRLPGDPWPSQGTNPSVKIPNSNPMYPAGAPATPPPTIIKDADGTYGSISKADVLNREPDRDPTQDTTEAMIEVQTLEDVSPAQKFALASTWDQFFASITDEQHAYQYAHDAIVPTSDRSLDERLAPIQEFAPDDEPVPTVPGGSKGVFISDIDVTHSLRFTDSNKQGMAVTIRGFIWNHQGDLAKLSLFVKDLNTGAPVSTGFTRYRTPEGFVNSGVGFAVKNQKIAFQSVLYLPYYTLPMRASNLQLITQLNVAGQIVSSGSHRFSFARDRTISVPGSSVFTSKGVRYSSHFDANGNIHAFFSYGFADCCIPQKVYRTLQASPFSQPDNGFPSSFNFHGWGINTFQVEWDTPNDVNDINNWNDGSTRRHIEEFVLNHPGDTFIFYGHSFGGDTILKVALCLDGNEAYCTVINQRTNPARPRIAQLIVTDPVKAGALRASYALGQPRQASVIANFQNYWSSVGDGFAQSVLGNFFGSIVDTAVLSTLRVPLNFASSGVLQVRTPEIHQVQEEQSVTRHFDGSPVVNRCGWFENCPGKRAPSCSFKKWKLSCQPGDPGHKQRRLHHSELPEDDYIQYRIMKNLCDTRAFERNSGVLTFAPVPSPCDPVVSTGT